MKQNYQRTNTTSITGQNIWSAQSKHSQHLKTANTEKQCRTDINKFLPVQSESENWRFLDDVVFAHIKLVCSRNRRPNLRFKKELFSLFPWSYAVNTSGSLGKREKLCSRVEFTQTFTNVSIFNYLKTKKKSFVFLLWNKRSENFRYFRRDIVNGRCTLFSL